MKCPYCQYRESKVIDTRPTEESEKIRRRRECLNCKKRFTTYEIVEITPLMVVKNDKSIEPFSREKLLNGISRACEKRSVSIKSIETAVDNIEFKLKNKLEYEVTEVVEVTSQYIGELAMEEMRNLDEVAYLRFASVYRKFEDAGRFLDELNKIVSDQKSE